MIAGRVTTVIATVEALAALLLHGRSLESFFD